jgi:penicillin-binding protein 1B
MVMRDWLKVRPRSRRFRLALALLLLAPPLAIGIEATVRAKLGPQSLGPNATRVYARPMTYLSGDRPDRTSVKEHLDRLGYRSAQGDEVGIGEYYLGRRGWVIGTRAFRGESRLEPAGFTIVRFDYSGRISRLEDHEGRRRSHLSLEPELLGRIARGSNQDRLPVNLEEIPNHLLQALLTVEDQRFFEHGGLDLRRIVAAFAANVKAGQVVQGGSTLTQQLAKNLFLSSKRTLTRKIREAAMALTLERRYSKKEILQAYLNNVYLGQDGSVGIHGVGRAAQHFFGTDVANLDLAESALLVALIRAPTAYSPLRNPDTARDRRDLVLRLMRDRGAISPDQFKKASTTPISVKRPVKPIQSARYFLDYLANGFAQSGRDRLEAGGHAVVSTLDSNLQRAAESAVKNGLARLERDFDWLAEGENGQPLQAALVAMDPRTGEILAMVGGRDYGTSQFNRATDARRQPGSAFKPVVALAALSRPRGNTTFASQDETLPPFTLASILDDSPFQVETPVGRWQPANYDRSFSGQVTMRDALERSLNVPFARLGMAIGPERIVEVAQTMGIHSPLDPFPSLALGASEVSPLELTRAFGVLAAKGFRAVPKSIYSEPTTGQQVFEPAETFLVTSALRGVVDRGTGRGLRDRGFYGDVAAKSGTTNDFRDAWFVGYTNTLAVAVWVGFDRGKRLELPGAGVALPIFADFLEAAVGSDGRSGPWGSEGFYYPAGLDVVNVESSTGRRAGWGCSGEPELFLRGTAPRESCGEFRLDGRSLRVLFERGGEELGRLFRRFRTGEGRH